MKPETENPKLKTRGSKLFRVIRWTLLILAAFIGTVAMIGLSIWIYFHPKLQTTKGLVYGQRGGQDLTFDILRPAKPNGLGVILIVSGGWKSAAGSFKPWIVAPLLRHGYTIFPVYHVSQPEATVMEINDDIHRAVRFVRHHARDYGVDPQRLGVTGGSAGGHLSLMLATRGAVGPGDTADPIDAESSSVQAVAIFYPCTDLLHLGNSVENLGDGGPPKNYVSAFGPNSTNLAAWKVIGHDLSPIYYINSNLPPTLIYHGDADILIPLDQSQRFQTEARKLGRPVELVVHHGGGHGWFSMVWDIRQFADWFDRYLRP